MDRVALAEAPQRELADGVAVSLAFRPLPFAPLPPGASGEPSRALGRPGGKHGEVGLLALEAPEHQHPGAQAVGGGEAYLDDAVGEGPGGCSRDEPQRENPPIIQSRASGLAIL
jgi:hypothetical protein